MDIKRLTGMAKGAADKAKEAFDERGGVQGLKQDLGSVKDAASKPGSLKEKAAAAKDALGRDPHADAVAEAEVVAEPAAEGAAEASSGEPAAPAGA